MNINQIKTFIEVMELGGLNKAASRLYLSQSTVTRQIQRLEQELDCHLIDRYKGKFILTPEGKIFLNYAERVYQENKNLISNLARIRQGITGSLKLVSPPNIAEIILPQILSEFKYYYPSIEVNITVVEKHRIAEVVSQGKEIVGFRGIRINENDIESIKISEDELVFIIYPEHPLIHKKEINIFDIIGEPIITVDIQDIQKIKELQDIGLYLRNCQPKIVMGTMGGVLSAVESKLGIGLISHRAILKSEALGLIRVLRVKGLRMKRSIYCVFRKDSSLSKLTGTFIKFIQDYSREHKFS